MLRTRTPNVGDIGPLAPATAPTTQNRAAEPAAAATTAAGVGAAGTAAAEPEAEAASVPAAPVAAVGKGPFSAAETTAANAKAATEEGGTIMDLLMSAVADPVPSAVQADSSFCDTLVVHLEAVRQQLGSQDPSVAAAAAAIHAYIASLNRLHSFKKAATAIKPKEYIRLAIAPYKRHFAKSEPSDSHEPVQRDSGTPKSQGVAGGPLTCPDGGQPKSCSNRAAQEQQQVGQTKNSEGEEEGQKVQDTVGFSPIGQQLVQLVQEVLQQKQECHQWRLYMELHQQMMLHQKKLVHLQKVLDYRKRHSTTRNPPSTVWVHLMKQHSSSDPKAAAEAKAKLAVSAAEATAAGSTLLTCVAGLLAAESRLGPCFSYPPVAAAVGTAQKLESPPDDSPTPAEMHTELEQQLERDRLQLLSLLLDLECLCTQELHQARSP
ncbi:hypothetical protein, conserved [Eimeria brunetti]|uniref:Uncharacterized protein n=1 Tax=Eimeria brunetti TaxID=51314 RepID=U6LZY4_9EIME|nr:hypothetical protein, conserved [Eimeria brunetti]